MYYTVDMIFRRKHVQCFVEALSINNNPGIIEFAKKDKLNALVKSYLVKPRENYKPMFGLGVVKILIPENNRDTRAMQILPKSAWKDLEEKFELQFYSLLMTFEGMGKFNPGKRKELRIFFLEAFGINEDIMNYDSFRKSYDRFQDKMMEKTMTIINNNNMNARTIYKSVI